MHGKNAPTRPVKGRSDRKRSSASKHETLRRKEIRSLKQREVDFDAVLASLSR